MDRPDISRQSTDDGTDTLYSPIYQQTYHSTYGARLESDHVFLQGTGAGKRLQTRQTTCVLEVGFGTGLNFLLTAHLSQLYSTPLHYVSLEKYLVPASILAQLNHQNLNISIYPAFMSWYSCLPELQSETNLVWSSGNHIRLELLVGDATNIEIPAFGYHAIYHDPFSPDTNPELWTADFFAKLFARLQPNGKLATYSVKGAVRRALQAVGFEVHKRPGPPGKREVLVAVKRG
jgi:tRNA U34 5-methylaminomethyl-2-thiouridine-forming methyltransferase MnmC